MNLKAKLKSAWLWIVAVAVTVFCISAVAGLTVLLYWLDRVRFVF